MLQIYCEKPYIPPPSPRGTGRSPARLPVKTQLVSVGREDELYIPPPLPHMTRLSLNTQFVSVGEEDALYIPPPEYAELPLNVQSDSVGEEAVLYIPPP
jgi:hypothetical protein